MNILLIDDHVMVLEALKYYLRELDPSVAVTTAGSLDEALEQSPEEIAYDLIVLDFKLPGVRGFAGYEAVAARFPDVPIVILSGMMKRNDALDLIEAGAAGVIPKRLGADAMIHALKLILSGEKYLPMALGQPKESAGTAPRDTAPKGLGELTARQREVLALLKQGLPNKQIAAQMGIKEVTVKLHLSRIFKKLGVSNRTEAVRIAIESDSEDPGGFHMAV